MQNETPHTESKSPTITDGIEAGDLVMENSLVPRTSQSEATSEENPLALYHNTFKSSRSEMPTTTISEQDEKSEEIVKSDEVIQEQNRALNNKEQSNKSHISDVPNEETMLILTNSEITNNEAKQTEAKGTTDVDKNTVTQTPTEQQRNNEQQPIQQTSNEKVQAPQFDEDSSDSDTQIQSSQAGDYSGLDGQSTGFLNMTQEQDKTIQEKIDKLRKTSRAGAESVTSSEHPHYE
eukprot:UN24948